jgi:hypothetical protein
MHRRLAHPSKEVVQRARKHVRDLPDFTIPEEQHVCPGCAQGKMTNKSFPPSESRKTVPFALIHSDLKSFPIESYHKYKYAIVFLDDATSHSWTMNLCSKDAAINATRQFLAMVRNKYKNYGRKMDVGRRRRVQVQCIYQNAKGRGNRNTPIYTPYSPTKWTSRANYQNAHEEVRVNEVRRMSPSVLVGVLL